MAEDGEDKKPIFTFKGIFSGGRTLRGDLSRVGHFLGLYPDDPNRFLGKKPADTTPVENPFTGVHDDRNAHFETGKTEHDAKILSMQDYRIKKKRQEIEDLGSY